MLKEEVQSFPEGYLQSSNTSHTNSHEVALLFNTHVQMALFQKCLQRLDSPLLPLYTGALFKVM